MLAHVGAFKATVHDKHIVLERGNYDVPEWYVQDCDDTYFCDVCQAQLPVDFWQCEDSNSGAGSYLCHGCMCADVCGTGRYNRCGVGATTFHGMLKHVTALLDIPDKGLILLHDELPAQSKPLDKPPKAVPFETVWEVLETVASDGTLFKDRVLLKELEQSARSSFCDRVNG